MANVLLCGSLMNVLDNIGIKPTLIGRQTARVLAPMIKDIAQNMQKQNRLQKHGISL
jgi:hypothetical protein